eukprot:3620612-Amphidinium_carterae.1
MEECSSYLLVLRRPQAKIKEPAPVSLAASLMEEAEGCCSQTPNLISQSMLLRRRGTQEILRNFCEAIASSALAISSLSSMIPCDPIPPQGEKREKRGNSPASNRTQAGRRSCNCSGSNEWKTHSSHPK